MISCPNWSSEGASGGTCSRGNFGGHRISAGTCLLCLKNGWNLTGAPKQQKVVAIFRKKGCGPCLPVEVMADGSTRTATASKALT